MKKRKFAMLAAALALTVALSACGNNNETEPTAGASSPTDIELPEPTPTPLPQPIESLNLCGIPVVSGSQATGVGYRGAEYDEGVLTLNSVDMVADYGNYAAIDLVGDVTIVLEGDSKITVTNGQSAILAGTKADGTATNITFTGEGSLTIVLEGESGNGIACSGTLTVESGALNISAADEAVLAEDIILAEGIVSYEPTPGEGKLILAAQSYIDSLE